MPFSRRQMLGGALAATAAAPFISRPIRAQTSAYPARTYPRQVVDLVQESLVIDMLGPIKIDIGPAPMTEKMAADFRASGISAFNHGVGIAGTDARDQVLSFFALWQHYLLVNSHVFTGVDKMADIVRAKRDGKCAVIMGVQNSEHFLKADDVKFFYDLGQRCSQLTYNSQTRIGSGSTERVDGGITDFGISIVEAMHKVGMLVDVSHCGDRTTLDAIAISKKPIAITHSNCRALNDHPRLKTDEAIKALAAKGGVMGISGVRNFVTSKDPTTVANIVDHIDHAVKLAGIDHVGIGSDADLNGYDDMPPEVQKAMRASLKSSYAFRDKLDTDGFDHPLKIYDLTEELLRRNYSNANIKAILGGNFQRLLTSTWGG
ncbi:dipeptidase [Sphingosinicella rhizophila]|uniref:Membrane dipeptidase n=1 Tax=Sphingosinicella rhizophila TaxID=3050082 RepID=A0ABU3Q5Y0_9SPHN|nr:membrane dipeptidase [Sphingosinicella sp. GR2756]MDT9598818.1 membrane dipeptidase [Sphingosinicella sp. GR2756]